MKLTAILGLLLFFGVDAHAAELRPSYGCVAVTQSGSRTETPFQLLPGHTSAELEFFSPFRKSKKKALVEVSGDSVSIEMKSLAGEGWSSLGRTKVGGLARSVMFEDADHDYVSCTLKASR